MRGDLAISRENFGYYNWWGVLLTSGKQRPERHLDILQGRGQAPIAKEYLASHTTVQRFRNLNYDKALQPTLI